jgi:hypothetical protein
MYKHCRSEPQDLKTLGFTIEALGAIRSSTSKCTVAAPTLQRSGMFGAEKLSPKIRVFLAL